MRAICRRRTLIDGRDYVIKAGPEKRGFEEDDHGAAMRHLRQGANDRPQNFSRSQCFQKTLAAEFAAGPGDSRRHAEVRQGLHALHPVGKNRKGATFLIENPANAGRSPRTVHLPWLLRLRQPMLLLNPSQTPSLRTVEVNWRGAVCRHVSQITWVGRSFGPFEIGVSGLLGCGWNPCRSASTGRVLTAPGAPAFSSPGRQLLRRSRGTRLPNRGAGTSGVKRSEIVRMQFGEGFLPVAQSRTAVLRPAIVRVFMAEIGCLCASSIRFPADLAMVSKKVRRRHACGPRHPARWRPDAISVGSGEAEYELSCWSACA